MKFEQQPISKEQFEDLSCFKCPFGNHICRDGCGNFDLVRDLNLVVVSDLLKKAKIRKSEVTTPQMNHHVNKGYEYIKKRKIISQSNCKPRKISDIKNN